MVKIFVVTLFILSLLQPCFSTTAKKRNIVIDGQINIPDEWHEDEIYYDSQNDSPWGVYNELHKLFISWDESALYIGVVGIQKDRNNLIVYIDTSPFSGIDDASKLKDPNNPQQLWWWRRGNKFPENFKPEFQWHMYEMQLDLSQGHGFFKINDDYTVISLNHKVSQKSSGGGTAKLGCAEIKIPWSVFYGCPFFHEDREIGILVCMTGGMDTKNTTDTSDDEFGSARDTIPDQDQPFPVEWTQKVELKRFLTIKLDRLIGRQPYSRNLKILDFTGDRVTVKFDNFPWDGKKASSYLVFCSTSFENIRQGMTKIVNETTVRFDNLSAGNTYYFAVAVSTDTGLSETVSMYVPEFVITKHLPQKFFFPTKDLILSFLYNGYTDEEVKLYWRYKGTDTEFNQILLERETKNNVYTAKLQSVQRSIEFYVTSSSKFRYPSSGLATIEVLNKDVVTLRPELSQNVEFYSGANYRLRLSIPQGSVSVVKDLFIENLPKENLLSFSLDDKKINLDDVEVLFRIYTEDYKNLKFAKPVEITFIVEKSDTVIFFDGETGFYDLPSVKAGKEVSFKLYSTGFVMLTKQNSEQRPLQQSKLKKVVNPKFSHTGPYLHLVFTDDSRKEVRIFDLNYNLVWESGTKYENCIIWDGKTNSFIPVPKGLYIYQIKFENGEVITGLCMVK